MSSKRAAETISRPTRGIELPEIHEHARRDGNRGDGEGNSDEQDLTELERRFGKHQPSETETQTQGEQDPSDRHGDAAARGVLTKSRGRSSRPARSMRKKIPEIRDGAEHPVPLELREDGEVPRVA